MLWPTTTNKLLEHILGLSEARRVGGTTAGGGDVRCPVSKRYVEIPPRAETVRWDSAAFVGWFRRVLLARFRARFVVHYRFHHKPVPPLTCHFRVVPAHPVVEALLSPVGHIGWVSSGVLHDPNASSSACFMFFCPLQPIGTRNRRTGDRIPHAPPRGN